MNPEPKRIDMASIPLRGRLAVVVRLARRLRQLRDMDALAGQAMEDTLNQAERIATGVLLPARDEPSRTAPSPAQVAAQAALEEAERARREKANNAIRSEIKATHALLDAARPPAPNTAQAIAKARDEALARNLEAVRHEQDLQRAASTEQVAAARRTLHDTERARTQDQHALDRFASDASHAASLFADAAVALLAELGFASIASEDVEAVSQLATTSGEDRPGPPVDPAESGPLGPLWPAGRPQPKDPAAAPTPQPDSPGYRYRVRMLQRAAEGLTEAIRRVPG